ncbi:MAG: universal stress protein, partial [Pseudomonadota bacterium]
YIPAEARAIIDKHNATVLDEIEAGFAAQQRALALGERLVLQTLQGRVDDTLARAARNHDMVVMGAHDDSATDRHVLQHPDRMALTAGRPVVVVPPGYDAEATHGPVLIAWNGSRAAARSMSDALALTAVGEEVVVLSVGDDPLPRPIEETVRHLTRHGLDARAEHADMDAGVAETILAHAERLDARLLVMGAFEHSKFRVDLVGGITATVLAGARVPVLLAH